MTNLDSILKSKGPSSPSYGFSSSQVWIWELDYKGSWALKNWCFWTVALEKTLWESLGLQGDPTNPPWRKSVLNSHWKDRCWGWNSVLWPPDVKSCLIWKDSDAERDWGQEEKGTTEDEMAGWYHWLHGCESEWTLGVGDGQGGLACCGSWGHKELDMTEWLKWTDAFHILNNFIV